MNTSDYLKRINYTGPLTPNLEVLNKLQKAHLLAVPFENLDIHYGHVIDLKVDRSFNKVVKSKRGGFCYELNSLFHELLVQLGFQTKRISARVYDEQKGYGKEYDHMALVVTIDGMEYLADVGFGEFTFHSLKMVQGAMQKDERGDHVGTGDWG